MGTLLVSAHFSIETIKILNKMVLLYSQPTSDTRSRMRWPGVLEHKYSQVVHMNKQLTNSLPLLNLQTVGTSMN